jgi:DNA-binding protein HU-beta
LTIITIPDKLVLYEILPIFITSHLPQEYQPMTKADIVEIIAEKTGHTARDVKIIVEQLLEEVKNCLVEENHLEIRGFGTFKVINQKARKARNPKTNQEVHVPAKKKAVFKVSRELNKMLK